MKFKAASSLINVIGLVVAWIAIFAFFAVKVPSFATVSNMELLARQGTIVAMAALGMTYVIVSAGIDLSVGSVVAFVSVVIAALLQAHYSPVVALVGGIAAGVLAGLVNGLLITKLKVGPFIITLGTLLAVRGVAEGLAHEQKIDAPMNWLDGMLAVLPPDKKWQIFPWGVWLMLVLALAVSLALKHTKFGRHVVAIGSNEQAARLCGVPVDRVKISVYALGGLFAGLAGLCQFSRLTIGDPTVATGLELDVIAAVVIGGASLSGGEGSILGSLLGGLIMATIQAGSTGMDLPNWVQKIVTGAIIVLAVALDRLRTRKAI